MAEGRDLVSVGEGEEYVRVEDVRFRIDLIQKPSSIVL